MGMVLRRLWGALGHSRRFQFGGALEAVLREMGVGDSQSAQGGDSTQPE